MGWIEDWRRRKTGGVSTMEDAPQQEGNAGGDGHAEAVPQRIGRGEPSGKAGGTVAGAPSGETEGTVAAAEGTALAQHMMPDMRYVNEDGEVYERKGETRLGAGDGETGRRGSASTHGTTANTPGSTGARSGVELMNGAFGNAWNLTPEEAEARLRRERAVSGAKALSDSILAFANSVYTGGGGNSATLPKTAMPSEMSFVDRVNEARREAYNRNTAQKQYEDTLAYRDQQLEIAKQKEQRAQEAQDKKNAWMDARIAELETKKDYGELRNKKMELENELKETTNPLQIEKLQAQIKRIETATQNDTRRTNAAVARAAHYVSGGSSGGRGGKGDLIYTADGTYVVPTGAFAKNRGALMKAAGVSATETYDQYGVTKTRNKPIAQIDEEIQQNWNEGCTQVMVNVGAYRQGSNAGVKPGVNANSSAGSGRQGNERQGSASANGTANGTAGGGGGSGNPSKRRSGGSANGNANGSKGHKGNPMMKRKN